MKRIVTMVLALILLLPTMAFAEGPAIVEMTASYKHPETGQIEDSGKNEGIGQGMAEGVLHPQALYEEVGGKAYLTIRLHMMDNIGKVAIGVAPRGGNFSTVSYATPQGKGEWKDFRFPVPGKNALIRLDLAINAMGRDVIFYGVMGNMTPGNTDFVVQKTAAAAPQKATAPAPKPASPQAAPKKADKQPVAHGSQAIAPAPSEPAKASEIPSDSAADSNTDTTDVANATAPSEDAVNDLNQDHGLLTDSSPEIQEMLNGEGSEEGKQDGPKGEKAPWGPATRTLFAGVVGILAFAACLSLTTAVFFYFLASYKRLKNELREEAKHEDDFSFDGF